MANRRSFLTKLGLTGFFFAASAPASPQSASETPGPVTSDALPSALPSPSASATTAKAPSAAATAIAATMRRFDPKLSDAELATIAAGIDDNAAAGAALNPKKRRLRNADEPAVRFAASGR